MKKRFLKIFGIALAVPVVLALIAGGIIGFYAREKILAGTFTVSEPELPESATNNAQGVPVGEPFEVRVSAACALSFETPFQLEFSLPEGLEVRENIEQKFEFAWTQRRGEIIFSLVAFNAGEFSGAKLNISSSDGAGTKQQTLAFPPIFAVLPATDPGEELSLAGKLEEQSGETAESLLWIFAVIVPLLALAVLIFLRSKKPKNVPEIPSWILAENEFKQLREEISSGRTGAIAAVSRISDIVRRYLSRRFGLSADAMTSQEFFAFTERSDSPLSVKHKQFLREFLSAADLIKFAGAAASADQAYSALDRASLLVRETIPAPEDSSEKN